MEKVSLSKKLNISRIVLGFWWSPEIKIAKEDWFNIIDCIPGTSGTLIG